MALMRSENVGDLMAALAKAQGEFPVVKKDTKNYYGGKYAQLDAIVDAVRPSLSKHGIAFYHIGESDLERRTAGMTTYLQLGEQWVAEFAESSAVERRWDKNLNEQVERFDTQTISIVWTYFKRIQLQAITGVAAEEDTDAQELVGNNPPLPPKRTTPAQAMQQPKPPVQTEQPKEPPKDKGPFKLMPDGILTCMITDVAEKQTKPKKDGDATKPYLVVGLNGYLRPAKADNAESVPHAFCYDTALFDALKTGKGKECQLKVDVSGKFPKVLDLMFCDGVEYVDGRVFVPSAPPAEEEEVPNV